MFTLVVGVATTEYHKLRLTCICTQASEQVQS